MSSTMRSTSPYGDPATRTRILEATLGVIDRDGAAVSLAAVARRAGVSRQAVYLHFGDRRGLLLAVVRWMDERLDLAGSVADVMAAEEPDELLRRMARLNATFWSQVAPVARVLQAAQHTDEELRTAWRDRMTARRRFFDAIVSRLAEQGVLAPGWTVSQAGGVLYGVTHFDTWRELTEELGWDAETYAESLVLLLRRAFVAG